MVAVAAREEPKSTAWLSWLAAARAWIFLILLLAFFECWAQIQYDQTFLFNPYNIRSIGMAAVTPLLLSLGLTFVIISAGIDLSVGFTMGLAAVIVASVIEAVTPSLGPWPALPLGMIAALAVVAIPGLINGWLIAWLNVPSLIGTLGMYGVARGAAFLLADGTTVPVTSAPLNFLGNGLVGGVPVAIVITLLFVAVAHFALSQTRFGQYTYAVGGGMEAAVRAGINVRRHLLRLYLISALAAGVAGIMYTARFNAGAAQAGEPLLLDSIAAVIIGGASLFGGSGTIVGTVIGALIIAVIRFGLVFVGVEPFWQFIAVGLVIIVSVMVDQSQKSLRRRPRT